MGYSAIYCNEKDIVNLKVTGELNPSMIAEPLKTAAKLLMENNCCRLLSDLRETYSTSSILETYHLPDIFEQVGFKHHLRQALIVTRLYDKMMFAETVCSNRSWKVKVFTDPDDAKNWLLTVNKGHLPLMRE